MSDRGSMARCEGECGAGGDDDDWLTLADKSPDDSDVVRRRVEERGSVVSRSIRRSAARARPLSHSCPSYTFLPHPSFVVPLRACASSGSRGETCVRVAIWRVDARDAWGFRVCALVSIEWKVPAPRVRALQSEKRGRREAKVWHATADGKNFRAPRTKRGTRAARGRGSRSTRRSRHPRDTRTRRIASRAASTFASSNDDGAWRTSGRATAARAPREEARAHHERGRHGAAGDERRQVGVHQAQARRVRYVVPRVSSTSDVPHARAVRPATARPVTSPSHPPPPPPTIIYSIPHR